MNKIYNPPFKYIDFIGAKKIKQSYPKKENLKKIKIAILQGSTVDELKNILELFLLNEGFQPVFYISNYNRFYEEALFPQKELLEFSPDLIYIHINNKNISRFPEVSDAEDLIIEKAEEEVYKYQSMWESINDKFSCNIIQNNFENPFSRILGSYDSVSPNGIINYTHRINTELCKKIMNDNNVHLNDLNYLSSKIGLEKWFNASLWYSYKYAISYDAIPYIAHNLTKIIVSIYGGSKKLVITDLDNTVWGGVIGDIGAENIKVGNDSPESEAYFDMQLYLKYLKSHGILLAASSKNEEKVAKNGINAKQSPLSLSDFSSFKANWNSKDISVTEILHDLNLSQDHAVFIDDNPAERGIVNLNLPSVAVPEIDDISSYQESISLHNFFERKKITSEDINRANYYKNEVNRKKTSKSFNNYSDYLRSLEMIVKFSEINNNNAERVVQLVNKTNQFNPTTRRYKNSEIQKLINDKSFLTITASLSDKYGDNGLVSVVILELKNQIASIDLWVMSCRVFQRGLEMAVFDYIYKELYRRKVHEIYAKYIPTDKNIPVKNFFKDLNFTMLDEKKGITNWKIKVVSDYQNKNQNIKIVS